MKLEEKIKEMAARIGIDPRKICVCIIPVKSNREGGKNGADK